MASRDHVSYPEQLAVKIQPSFERIKPSSVIYQFHKHSDGKILTTRDIQNVVARTQLNGDIDGAILLLERLCQYNGWFECLMKVLQDRDVKLDHFAEEMKKKKAQLDEEWNEKYGSIEQHPDSTGSTNSEFHLSRKTPQESSERQSEVSKASTSEEKFGPKSCPVSNEGTTENVVTENMRSLNFNLTVDAGDNGQLRPINVVGDIRANGQSDPGNPEDSDEDDFEVIRSNDYADMREEPLTRSLSNPAPVSDPQEQLPSGSNPTQSLSQEKNWGTSQPLNNVDGFPVEQHQSQERRQQEKKRECRHGEEYDYTEDDVATELSQIQGWHLGITEDEIWKKLSPLLMEDGHYILWYWKAKKRPALCVTDKKQVKTLLVHKKPSKTDRAEVKFHFINKHEKRAESLRGIVEYHLADGVKDVWKDKDTIYFLHPVD